MMKIFFVRLIVKVFHESDLFSINTWWSSVHTRCRDQQRPRTRIMLHGNNQANRLKGGERVMVTARSFRTAHFRKMHHPTTRTVLQRCFMKPTLLLHILCGNRLDLVEFHNLTANIPSKRESECQTVGICGRTDLQSEDGNSFLRYDTGRECAIHIRETQIGSPLFAPDSVSWV
jgi:hypothetical protein